MTTLFNKKALQAEVIPRSLHAISRDDISKSALKVLYRLNEAGYQAYLVGGSVRDILLGKHPKDFDVATDATPEEIKKLFKNSLIIGRRFRLVHVRYGRDIIEVATLRGEEHPEQEVHLHAETGMILRDNVFGELEDDVIRRDYTMNALYYNIADLSVVDYVNGVSDLNDRIIRMIGDPEQRFREDPVRIIRAVRLAAKLDFTIEKETERAMRSMKELLLNVAPARLFDEFIKMTVCGFVTKSYQLLHEYELFSLLFPIPEKSILADNTACAEKFLQSALAETDSRIQSGKTVNPAFLIAVMFWYPLQQRINELMSEGLKLYPAMAIAQGDVFKQLSPLMVPKRLQLIIRDIWVLQYHMTQTRRNRIYRCLYNPRFRAAYDFLLLRARSGEELEKLCNFWTDIQEATEEEQHVLIQKQQANSDSGGRRGRGRRGNRGRQGRRRQQ